MDLIDGGDSIDDFFDSKRHTGLILSCGFGSGASVLFHPGFGCNADGCARRDRCDAFGDRLKRIGSNADLTASSTAS